MKCTPYEILVTTVVVAIVLVMITVVVAEADRPTELVCDEPQVIAVTETATGVVVRCGAVEGEQ